MNQQEIIDVLWDKFVKSNGRRRTILVSGKWGVGKSYAWSFFVDHVKKSRKDVRTLTVSLFGYNDLSTLRNKLKSDYLLTKTHVGDFQLSQIVNRTIGNASFRSAADQASKKWIGVSIDPLSFVSLNFGPNYIICFDDLERKSPNIAMRDILGLIEEVRQSSSVVIIADETKFSESDKSEFYIFKEKVIDRTYSLETQVHDSLVKIFNSGFPNFNHTDTAIEMFETYGEDNIRTLHKLIDFLRDTSEHVNPDEELTRLCCAIVFESIAGNGDLNFGSFAQAPTFDSDDIYYKYFISDRYRSIGPHMCSFYTSNKIDPSVIENVLNPPSVTPDDELLLVFQDSFNRSAPSLQKAIEEFKSNVSTTNTAYFRNIERVIVLFFYAKYTNDYFHLGFNSAQLESDAFRTIQTMIDNTKPERLTSVATLEMYFIQEPNVARNLLNQVETLISKKIDDYSIDLFQLNFQQEQYAKCLEILHNNQSIFLHILNVFDELASPQCTRSYMFFIRQICGMPGHSQDIKNKLSQILTATSDSVIQNRINAILKEV